MEQKSTDSHAQACRELVARARTATLATLARDPAGYPFASLVSVADDGAGRPLLLLSTLAEHTRNALSDDRASLLFIAPGSDDEDPLTRARATLLGRCVRLGEKDGAPEGDPEARAELLAARERYLAVHPEASGYIDFKDFALWRLEVQALRYVGGFGRMSWVDPAAYAAL